MKRSITALLFAKVSEDGLDHDLEKNPEAQLGLFLWILFQANDFCGSICKSSSNSVRSFRTCHQKLGRSHLTVQHSDHLSPVIARSGLSPSNCLWHRACTQTCCQRAATAQKDGISNPRGEITARCAKRSTERPRDDGSSGRCATCGCTCTRMLNPNYARILA